VSKSNAVTILNWKHFIAFSTVLAKMAASNRWPAFFSNTQAYTSTNTKRSQLWSAIKHTFISKSLRHYRAIHQCLRDCFMYTAWYISRRMPYVYLSWRPSWECLSARKRQPRDQSRISSWTSPSDSSPFQRRQPSSAAPPVPGQYSPPRSNQGHLYDIHQVSLRQLGRLLSAYSNGQGWG